MNRLWAGHISKTTPFPFLFSLITNHYSLFFFGGTIPFHLSLSQPSHPRGETVRHDGLTAISTFLTLTDSPPPPFQTLSHSHCHSHGLTAVSISLILTVSPPPPSRSSWSLSHSNCHSHGLTHAITLTVSIFSLYPPILFWYVLSVSLEFIFQI